MTPVEIWLALAAFYGTTLSIIAYFRKSGTDLEERVNTIVKEKKQIVIKSYEELLEKIFEVYKTKRKLTEEHKEELEKIADISSRLDDLPYDLSEIVDKFTNSFVYGFVSVLTMLLLAYLPSLNLDALTSFWSQIIVIGLMTVFVYRYLADGIMPITPLRKFEKLINAIDRCNTFKKLYELI